MLRRIPSSVSWCAQADACASRCPKAQERLEPKGPYLAPTQLYCHIRVAQQIETRPFAPAARCHFLRFGARDYAPSSNTEVNDTRLKPLGVSSPASATRGLALVG